MEMKQDRPSLSVRAVAGWGLRAVLVAGCVVGPALAADETDAPAQALPAAEAAPAATSLTQEQRPEQPPEPTSTPRGADAPALGWKWVLGAGASSSSGNTDSTSVTFNLDGERTGADDKWRVQGRSLYVRDGTGTSAEQLAADVRHDKDISLKVFGFGQVGSLRDRPANINSRLTAGLGLGRHLIDTADHTWDATVGLGYAQDRYEEATEVNGRVRNSFGRAELLLGQSSSHRLSASTTARQQLDLSQALDGTGLRTEWKGGLAVAMTETLKLTANFSVRYNSDPGAGLKKTDTLLFTGISYTLP